MRAIDPAGLWHGEVRTAEARFPLSVSLERVSSLRVRRALERGGAASLTVRLLPGADHALLVKPTPQAAWVAERPADGWVASMIDWARKLR